MSHKHVTKKKRNETVMYYTKMVDSKFEDGELNHIITTLPDMRLVIDNEIKQASEDEISAAWAGSISPESTQRINRLIDFLYGVHYTITGEFKNPDYGDFVQETIDKSTPEYQEYLKLKPKFSKYD